MIGSLFGTVIHIDAPMLIMEVHGVGYELEVSQHTLSRISGTDAAAQRLWTHLHVREDAQLLYGFAELNERRLFRSLIRISGVGAKLALAMLSSLTVGELLACVQQQDIAGLQRVPGIGKKTAERLLVELKGRIDEHWQDTSPTTGGSNAVGKTAVADDMMNEASQALQTLGYRPAEIKRLLSGLQDEAEDSGQLIRLALKKVAPRA